jgi:YD repeat-containing protein
MNIKEITRYGLAAIAVTVGLPVHAQSEIAPVPPHVSATDEMGVDLISRMISLTIPDVSIGSSGSALEHVTYFANSRVIPGAMIDNFIGGIFLNSSTPLSPTCDYKAVVGIGDQTECFSYTIATIVNSNGSLSDKYTFTPLKNNGSVLIDSQNGFFIYTTKDGTEYTIDRSVKAKNWIGSSDGAITKIKFPSGITNIINWKFNSSDVAPRRYRIHSIQQNNGFQLVYKYLNNIPYFESDNWTRLSSVTAVNNAFENCQISNDNCIFSNIWPQASYFPEYNYSTGLKKLTLNDSGNRSTIFNMDVLFRITSVKPPESNIERYTYTHCQKGIYGVPCTASTPSGTSVLTDGVKSAAKDGLTWTYSPSYPTSSVEYFDNSSQASGKNALSVKTYDPLAAGNLLRLISITKPNGTIAYFDSNNTNNMTSQNVSMPADVTYTYNPRGDILTENRAGVNFRTMTYPSPCNPKYCSKPATVKDANGNVTTYLYDPNHGGVLSETGPAVNGISPQKRYVYAQRYAWISNGAGGFIQASSPIWVLTKQEFCRTTSATAGSCAGGSADEVVTDYDYGPNSGPNNLLVRGVAVTADGQTLRTCFSYDKYGNKISETLPAANLQSCP